MSEEQGSANLAALRAQMRANVRFRFELLAAVSRTAREHGVALSDEALGNLVFVDSSELEEELLGVGQLPGGTNC